MTSEQGQDSTQEKIARLNWDAAPISLYDMPSPSHGGLVLRNAIENHRQGERPPVSISPNKSGVSV